MRLFQTLFLLLASCFFASAQSTQKLLDSANACIDAKNYGRAINIYSTILSIDSINARVYELRGLAYEGISDYESALRDYVRSVDANPRYWQGYMRRADLLTKAQAYDQALKDYNYALQFVDSANAYEVLYVNRGMVKRRMNDLTGAKEDLQRALVYNPSSLGSLVDLAMVLSQLGDTKEGIQCLEKAIHIDSTFEGGYGNLAFLYSEIGEYKKALVLSNKLIAMHPKDGVALNNRGFIKYKMNDLSGALEDINNSILLFAENSFAFKNRGLVYIAMKRNNEACADFQKSIYLGFSTSYGTEVEELQKKHCNKITTGKSL
jgi:tetratricopeptide (TPR) repeat protein